MPNLFRSIASSVVGFLTAGATLSGALASDLTLKARFSDTTELNDNYSLLPGRPSGVLGSYSSIFLSALQRTPTMTFAADGNVSYRKYFGPGAPSPSEATSDGVNLRLEKLGQGSDKDFVTASYQRSDAAMVQRREFGIATVTGDIDIYSATGGGSRQINARDTVSWLASANSTTFSPGGSGTTPFKSYLTQGSWNHRASEILDFTALSSLSWLLYDNATQTKTTIWRTTAGLQVKLSPQLNFTGNAGIAVFNTVLNASTATVPAPVIDPITGLPLNNAPASPGTTAGPVWEAALSYNMLKTTRLGIRASEAISQGTFGDLTKFSTVGANVSHDINSKSNLNFLVNASKIVNSSLSSSDVFTAGANYNYTLAREWQASLAYTYLLRSSTITSVTASPPVPGSAHSNSIILTVGHDVTLKP